jgi:hypothetical protein
MVYVVTGALFRSLDPGGVLNWQARRLRKVFTFFLPLGVAASMVVIDLRRGRIGIPTALVLWGCVASLATILATWWWRDRQKEAAARDAWLKRVQEEGVPAVAPAMSRGKSVWNWFVTAYAVFLVITGLYAFVHWVVTK